MRQLSLAAAFAMLLLLTGCTVGPNYNRPKVNAPATYRNDFPDQNTAAQSLGDQKWSTIFQDQQLQQLIGLAQQQNFDVKVAAARVLQANEQVTIARSYEFPTVSGQTGIQGARQPQLGAFPAYAYAAGQLAASASWTIDFWGQYRRQTEAARANLLASKWGQRAVMATVVANVANDYFQLRELDLELDIAKRTLDSRRQSLTITQTLESGGATSMEDVLQGQQLVETAAETIPSTERQIAQEEDAIRVLLGDSPGGVPRGKALTDQPVAETVPAGIPSDLLERRPDIRQAEQQLISANAQIGVARAQLFPQILLTGSGGTLSSALNRLFTGAGTVWSFNGAASQPIFNAGRLRANVRYNEAVQQQYVVQYQQTIQNAFRDVSDALIGYRKNREFRDHQQLLTNYARNASNLSDMRYRGGVTSYLEVLTNQTNYFAAELALARAELAERVSLVQIYNALGGGWQ